MQCKNSFLFKKCYIAWGSRADPRVGRNTVYRSAIILFKGFVVYKLQDRTHVLLERGCNFRIPLVYGHSLEYVKILNSQFWL